ncbi:hypothetical protein Golomagni_08085 [Golovinomyces magnicellulatus]|nr:hypothetical protein Golomagni_08085 [Golovinomyces magnicellulatus]
MLLKALVAATLACVAAAHGEEHPRDESGREYNDWMDRHMTEEHRIDGWDTGSFFTLHDYDNDGHWRPDEIMRTYGLMDVSNKDVSWERKEEVVKEILSRIDYNHDGAVSRDEWTKFIDSGAKLPDLGTGPGHHGDDEYEYEIHHWEKYHDENTKLEDLTHPEDIEHFKHHEEMEEEQHRMEEMDQMPIVEANIPRMFLRQ